MGYGGIGISTPSWDIPGDLGAEPGEDRDPSGVLCHPAKPHFLQGNGSLWSKDEL